MDELLKLAESIRRWKWLVLAVGAVAMVAALAVTLSKDSSFTASSSMIVGGTASNRGADQDAVVVRGYVEELNGGDLQERLRERADIPDDVSISASAIAGSSLLAISATSSSAERSVASAQALAQAFQAETLERFQELSTNSLEAVNQQLRDIGARVSVVEGQLNGSPSAEEEANLRGELLQLQAQRTAIDAQLESVTSLASNPNLVGIFAEARTAEENQPRVLSNAILGLLGGLVLGAAVALVLGALELRVTSPSIVRSRLGLPTLGSISGTDPQQRQEDLQSLASSVALMDAGLQSVAVTSPAIGEGKTLVASSIARYRAALGDRVILIDANFRGAAMNGRPGREQLGLAQLLEGGDEIQVPNVLIDSGSPNLSVIPAGTAPDDPYSLLTADRMSRVLEHAALLADLLVIDTAAVLSAAESQVVCSVADRTIMVLDSVDTQTAAAVEARDTLQRVHARLLGVVLTRVSKRRFSPRETPPRRPRPRRPERTTTGS